MPLPLRKSGEHRRDFVRRFMSDPAARAGFPRRDRRFAACLSHAKFCCAADESKDTVVPHDSRTQQLIDIAVRSMPDSVAKRKVRESLDEATRAVAARIRHVATAVAKGSMDVEDGVASGRAALQRGAGIGATLGLVLAGLPDWKMTGNQIRMVSQHVEDDVGYLRAFLSSTEAMGRSQRAGMYGGIVGSTMWSMWGSVIPSGDQLEWRLGVAEHCADCLDMAANSPYDPPGMGDNPLTTWPRSGDTRCLTNCMCSVESVGAVESGIGPDIGIEVVSIAGVALDPMSGTALVSAKAYQDLAERYAYYLRLAASGLPGASEYRRMAALMKSRIEELAKSLGQGVRFSATDPETILPISIALGMGRRFVDPANLGDDLVLAVAIVIGMDGTDRGTITSVSEAPPAVMLDTDPERVYRLDEVGRYLVAVEEAS